MADIDRKEIDKRDVPVDENYNCDLSDFIDNLSDRADSSYNADARKRWVDHCKELRGKYPVVLQEYRDSNIINSYYFTEKLSEHTSEGVNVVVDTGSVCNIVSQDHGSSRKIRDILYREGFLAWDSGQAQ